MTKKQAFPATLVRAGKKAFYETRMTKKILTTVFCLALALNAFAATSYTITGSGSNLTLTITGTGDMPNYTYPNYAPWYSQRMSIKTVLINSGVTSIGNQAFRSCSGLTSITIPESVTKIGGSAFSDCSGLTSITIPNSVTAISLYAFSGCTNLKELTIADGNATLYFNMASSMSDDGKVFENCPLETVYLGRNIEYGNYYLSSPFYQKTTIEKLTIGNSVTSIGQQLRTFYGCTKLKELIIEDCDNTLDIDFSNLIFNGCPIETVYLGRNISSCPFKFGNKTTEVTISNSVTSICNSAFSGCTDLTAINVDAGNNAYSSIDGILFNKSQTTLIRCPCGKQGVATTIPGSVTEIGSSAFSDCIGLTSITIPNSVTSIGSSAFSGCTGLTAINVDAGNNAYSSIDGILFNKLQTTLIQCPRGKQGVVTTIPNSVTSIGNSAFYSCSGLTSITIPYSVTSIGSSAFYNCNGLTEINCKNPTPPTIPARSFSDVNKQMCTLYVPTGCKDVYQSITIKQDFYGIIVWDFANIEEKEFRQPQTINFSTISTKTYGDASFTLSASSSSSLPVSFTSNNTAVATVSGNTLTIVGAGEATITASQAGNAEYAIATTSQTLSVTKAALTVTADNKTRRVGEANPVLTYSISGFKNNETQSVIDVLPTITTTATQASSAGTYPITASGASDNNYSFSYQNGTLTVNALETYSITFDAQSGSVTPATKTVTYSLAVGTLPTPTRTGYTFGGWFTAANGSGTQYTDATVYNTAGDITLYAKWTANTYTITASATTGGTISPSGAVSVASGSAKTFVFTPNSGYVIQLVLVDEIPNATAKTNGYYTFSNVTENHEISVFFQSTSGIDDVSAVQLSVYPNPAKEELFIKSELEIQKVEIYSLSGKLLLQENNFNEKISVSAFTKGIYLLKVHTDKGVAVSKVVKE